MVFDYSEIASLIQKKFKTFLYKYILVILKHAF